MADFFQAVAQVLQLVVGSSAATSLTVVGIILLLLTAVMAYIGLDSKPDETSKSLKVALYLCLVGGILFSAAGPSWALYNELSYAAQHPIRIESTDEIRQRLADNARVRYVVRLIPYNDPAERQELSIDNVSTLGPAKQLYSFVGDYEELKGRTVADALDMVGVTRNFDRVTAIIFPLPKKRVIPRIFIRQMPAVSFKSYSSRKATLKLKIDLLSQTRLMMKNSKTYKIRI